MRLQAVASLLAVAALASGFARAADGFGTEVVRVEYAAPGGCPDQGAFEAELAEHLGTTTFARFGELARTLTVSIEAEPAGFRASVELVDRRGQSTERAISAPTCEQAVQTIALVAALAARSQIEELEREGQAAKSLPAPALGAPSSAPAAGAASVTPATQAEPAPQSPPATERSLSFEVSAGAAAATGVGPGVAPGLLVGVRLALTGSPERSIVLSGFGYDTFRRSLEVADVRFSVLKGRLELCPVEPRLSAHVRLSPCAGFEVGSQTGQSYADGERVETPRSVSDLWLATTLAARLGFRFGAFGFGFGGELGIPLIRNDFALTRPDRGVYTVPRVTSGLSATVGLAW